MELREELQEDLREWRKKFLLLQVNDALFPIGAYSILMAWRLISRKICFHLSMRYGNFYPIACVTVFAAMNCCLSGWRMNTRRPGRCRK